MINFSSLVFSILAIWGVTKVSNASSVALRVAAAADLKFAMPELAKEFKTEHPDREITATFGSSGNFATQIKQGAPFDLFFSADTKTAEMLEGSTFKYSLGHLVLWVPNDSKIDLSRGLETLNLPNVKKIAIANPAHAPYGIAATEALKNAKLYDKISSKIVMGENIAQTAQFVETKAADIGLIAIALALSPTLKKEGRFVEIDNPLYSKMIQSGIVLKSSGHQSEAKEFRDFILSDKGQKILKNFGMGQHQ